jgi:hypothetical protein
MLNIPVPCVNLGVGQGTPMRQCGLPFALLLRRLLRGGAAGGHDGLNFVG